MDRRRLLSAASLAAAPVALAAPALAQAAPEIRWRMASSWGKQSDIPYGAAEYFCRQVSEMTEGRFRIQLFGAGELVPGFQVFDAASSGSLEAAHSVSIFYTGKDAALAFGTTLPFMLDARQQHAWLWHGGGIEALDKVYGKFGVKGLPCGNSGTQMGGWFRKEIKTLEDLRGLKFRAAGLAGNVLAKLGVVPQQIAPSDIYPALERGTIDGLEFIGPHDDEKLGVNRVARYYYFPGWMEGGAVFSVFFNLEKFSALPKAYRVALETASAAATTYMMAESDLKNAQALLRLVAGGTQLRQYPNEVIDALYRAAQEVYAEISATNPTFKALLEEQTAFRDRLISYNQVADFAFDAMMLRLRRAQAR